MKNLYPPRAEALRPIHKPDGVGLVDNRPSTNKPNPFDQQKRKTTPDTGPDTGHLTCDMWWEVSILLKFQLPTFYSLGVMMF